MDKPPYEQLSPKHLTQFMKFIISTMCKDINYKFRIFEPVVSYDGSRIYRQWYTDTKNVFFKIFITDITPSGKDTKIGIRTILHSDIDPDNNQEICKYREYCSNFYNLDKSTLQNIVKDIYIYNNIDDIEKCWMALEGLDLEEMLIIP